MTINQNTTKINTIKNTTLPELLQKINSLPDAGSGGGSAVETCTVTIKAPYYVDVIMGSRTRYVSAFDAIGYYTPDLSFVSYQSDYKISASVPPDLEYTLSTKAGMPFVLLVTDEAVHPQKGSITGNILEEKITSPFTSGSAMLIYTATSDGTITLIEDEDSGSGGGDDSQPPLPLG